MFVLISMRNANNTKKRSEADFALSVEGRIRSDSWNRCKRTDLECMGPFSTTKLCGGFRFAFYTNVLYFRKKWRTEIHDLVDCNILLKQYRWVPPHLPAKCFEVCARKKGRYLDRRYWIVLWFIRTTSCAALCHWVKKEVARFFLKAQHLWTAQNFTY